MKYIEEMEDLKDALEQARETGDRQAEAAALYGIGKIYLKENVLDAAREFWEDCLKICRENGREKELAGLLLDLGDLSTTQDQWDTAANCYQESYDLFKKLTMPQGRAKALERMGEVAVRSESFDQALAWYEEGLQLCLEHKDQIGGLYFLDQLLPIFKVKGASDRVEQIYRQSITLAESLGDRDRMALGLVGLADLYQHINREKEARPFLEMAHDIFLRIGKEKEAGLIRQTLEKTDPDSVPRS